MKIVINKTREISVPDFLKIIALKWYNSQGTSISNDAEKIVFDPDGWEAFDANGVSLAPAGYVAPKATPEEISGLYNAINDTLGSLSKWAPDVLIPRFESLENLLSEIGDAEDGLWTDNQMLALTKFYTKMSPIARQLLAANIFPRAVEAQQNRHVKINFAVNYDPQIVTLRPGDDEIEPNGIKYKKLVNQNAEQRQEVLSEIDTRELARATALDNLAKNRYVNALEAVADFEFAYKGAGIIRIDLTQVYALVNDLYTQLGNMQKSQPFGGGNYAKLQQQLEQTVGGARPSGLANVPDQRVYEGPFTPEMLKELGRFTYLRNEALYQVASQG